MRAPCFSLLALVCLLLCSLASGQSSGSAPTSTARYSYPTNCCRYRFASPSVPHVLLPAYGENRDPVLVRGNPIVDASTGHSVSHCNSSSSSSSLSTSGSAVPQAWSVDERAWTPAGDGDLALRVENGVVRCDPPSSDSGEVQRLRLMSGRLVQLDVTCAPADADSGMHTQAAAGANCLQLWVGPYDEREAQRPPCLRLGQSTSGTDGTQQTDVLGDGVAGDGDGNGGSVPPPPLGSAAPPLRPHVSFGVVLFALALVAIAMQLLLVVDALSH